MPAPPDVILVDDEEAVLAASAQTLELADLAVRCVSDPTEVAALVGSDFPGVLVTDVRMPRLDGLALMR
ncbi:MAG: response regulator, partial [Planctomycetes bacterium]|nr:response regulator [Planctomycetota bacterium]